MSADLLKAIKRCLRIYGACSAEALIKHLTESGIPAASMNLPAFLEESVAAGQLRVLPGARGRTLYALPLEETQ